VIGGHEEDPAFGRGHAVDCVQKAAEGQAVQALVGSLESWKIKLYFTQWDRLIDYNH